jgi:hypothetical protein
VATALTARLYLDGERPLPELLAGLAEAIEAWRPPRGLEAAVMDSPRWQGLKVLGTAGRQVIHDQRDPLDRAALGKAAARFTASTQLLSTLTSVPCWRVRDGREQAGWVPVSIDAWGDARGSVFGEDPRHIWGSAAVSFANAGPFLALADRPGAEADRVNGRVEDNLEALTALVLDLAVRLQPVAIKVFTDQGAYLPFNAHLAYYRSDEAVLDDLRTIARVWRAGLPGHQIPPLAQLEDAHPSAFHAWRSDEQRRALRLALQARVDRAADVGSAQVRSLLASGRFDTLTAGAGFTILDYPHVLDAFVDRFFLELLDRPTEGATATGGAAAVDATGRGSRYFIVGIRPVRLRVHEEGMACEALDWNTGELVRDGSYLSRVIAGHGEVEEVSLEAFEQAVAERRAEIEARRS